MRLADRHHEPGVRIGDQSPPLFSASSDVDEEAGPRQALAYASRASGSVHPLVGDADIVCSAKTLHWARCSQTPDEAVSSPGFSSRCPWV